MKTYALERKLRVTPLRGLAVLLGLGNFFAIALFSQVQVQNLSISPSSGSGSSAQFVMRFSDSSGAANIDYAYFDIYAVGASTDCMGYWSKSGNQLILRAGDGTAWLNPVTPAFGSSPGSGAVSSSTCTLSGAGSSVTYPGGNEVDVTISLVFPSTFVGTKYVAVRADDLTYGVNSGFQGMGTWNVTAPPQTTPTVVIDIPSPGGVISGTATLMGWALDSSSLISLSAISLSSGDIPAANVSSKANYSRPDVCAASAFSNWLPCPGNPSTVGWYMNVDTTPQAGVAQGVGKTITVSATTPDNRTGNAQNTGVVIDQPPTISSSPTSGSGSTQTFAVTVNSYTGPQYVQWVNGWIAPSLGAAHGCVFSYWPSSNTIFLQDDNGSSWAASGAVGSSSTDPNPSNSQCTLNLTASVYSSGTLYLNITFKSAFQGTQQLWWLASDNWLPGNYWTSGGTWTVPSGTPPPPLISTNSLPLGEEGASYNPSLSATGGVPPYSWSVAAGSSLPTWLSLGASTGQLAGVPIAGVYSFTLQVTDSALSSATKTYTLTISNPLAITTSATLPAATVGLSYGPVAFAATGGTQSYTWSALSPLPAGMTFANGVLAGIPTSANTFTLTVQVSDGSVFISRSFNITVTPAPTFTVGLPTPAASIPFPASSLPYSINFTQTITGVNGFTCCVAVTAGLPNLVLATYTNPIGQVLNYEPGGLTVSINPGALSTTSGISGSINLYTNNTSGINSLPGQGTYIFYFSATSGATTTTFSVPVIVGTPGPQYYLTTAMSPTYGGTITPASGWYPAGAVVSIAASSGSGYQFTGFSGATTTSTSPTSVTMNSNASVTANFAPAAQYPTVTFLQTAQTVASGGAVSFPVYVTQSNSATASLSVTGWFGGLSPVIRPASLTGSGWATVFMYGPSVSSNTTYSFNVQASGSSASGQASAALTVTPSGLQPSFLLSTTANASLASNIQTTVPVIIDAVGGAVGNVSFISNTPGVTVSNSSFAIGSTANLTVTLAPGVDVPRVLTLIGTDTTGQQRQLMANCHRNPTGGGGSGASGTAYPQPVDTIVVVPNDGTGVPYSFSIDGLSTSALQQIIGNLPACVFPSGTGLYAQVTGGYNDTSGLTGLSFLISTDPATGPALIQDKTCQITVPAIGLAVSIVFRVVAISSSCSPSISSLQVNLQNDSFLSGTEGTVTINGTCLLSVSNVSSDTPAITIIPPVSGGYSDTVMTLGYESVACLDGDGACATSGEHFITVAAQQRPGQPAPTPSSKAIYGTRLTVQKVSYGGVGNIAMTADILNSNNPAGLPIVPPQWVASNPGSPPQFKWPVAYVRNSSMSGTVEFALNPPPHSNISNIRVEGAVQGLEGYNAGATTLIGSGLNILANTNTTGPVSFVANNASAPKTRYYPNLQVKWSASGDGNACALSNCQSTGTSAEPFYITLATPYAGAGTAITNWATAVYLAVAHDGATTPAQAFQNTWANFALPDQQIFPNTPANVTNWTNDLLKYYPQGVPGNGCAVDLGLLLNTANGGGQCSSFALLFEWSLAMNGITIYKNPSCGGAGSSAYQVSIATVNPTVANEWMLVKNWGTVPNPHQLLLGYPFTGQFNKADKMVKTRNGAPPSGSGLGWGDLVYLSGIPGASNSDPAEKFFINHVITQVLDPSLLAGCQNCGPFFDPSYGVTYLGAPEFQSTALAGYGLFLDSLDSTTDLWGIRPIGTPAAVSLTATATCPR